MTNNPPLNSVTNQWELLASQFPYHLSLTVTRRSEGFVVREYFNDRCVFSYCRAFDGSRRTEVHRGLVGLTLISPHHTLPLDTVHVTEGISDFLALRIMVPELFTLAHTSLNLSLVDAGLLSKLTRQVVYHTDNDKAGLTAAAKIREQLQRLGMRVKIVQPFLTYTKDVADEFTKSHSKLFYQDVVNYYKASDVW